MRLIATARRDTDDNQEFDYTEIQGEEDVPYVPVGDNPIIDDAVITIG